MEKQKQTNSEQEGGSQVEACMSLSSSTDSFLSRTQTIVGFLKWKTQWFGHIINQHILAMFRVIPERDCACQTADCACSTKTMSRLFFKWTGYQIRRVLPSLIRSLVTKSSYDEATAQMLYLVHMNPVSRARQLTLQERPHTVYQWALLVKKADFITVYRDSYTAQQCTARPSQCRGQIFPGRPRSPSSPSPPLWEWWHSHNDSGTAWKSGRFDYRSWQHHWQGPN